MLTAATLRRALVALLLAVPLVATGGTAQAAACSGSSGVTVVVQFTSGTVTSCASGDPSTGAQALMSAGFSVTYVNGEAFVCRINNQPAGSTCSRTPPANAYWAYFHAQRGGSWAYSTEGATTYDPAPGSVEGWRFGNGAKPSTAPPPATATPKPKPKPAPKPTSTPSAASTAAAAASPAPSTGKTAAARATRTQATRAKVEATARAKAKAKAKAKATNAAVEAATSASAPAATQAAGLAAPRDQTGPEASQGGGNVPWLWGLVALVVIGGAAGAVTLVRRH